MRRISDDVSGMQEDDDGEELAWKGGAMAARRVIQGLGEIALQVQDLDLMTAFYTEVVNLELLRRFERSSFFRIADGVAGHTQVLALFDRDNDGPSEAPPQFRRPPLDHIAFAISLDDLASERERLKALECDVSEAFHAWVGWRSLYIADPEGNQVEWVCYDAAALGD
jgi:catechol-2,3-dioxygenase